MRTIKFILVAIFAVIIGILLFANGGDIVVHLWPNMTDYGLPASPAIELPIAVVALACGLVGFILGSLREYLREGQIRADRKRTRKEAQALKNKIDEMTRDAADDDIPALPAR